MASLAVPMALALSARASALSQKPYGVLLLGEGGGPEWRQVLSGAAKRLDRVPLQFAPGLADGAAMQRAIDALQAQGVQRIAVVPLFASTRSDVMDQNRYLLGIRDSPSSAFVSAVHAHLGKGPERLRVKVPLAMAAALDDDPILVDMLADRAKALGHGAGKDTLVLIGEAPASAAAAREWVGLMSALAQKAAQRAGIPTAQAMALRNGDAGQARERSEREIRAALQRLRAKGGLVVVPLELSPGLLHNRLRRLLDGMFVRYDGRALLPDERAARWIEQSAAAASRLPDMRRFKPVGAAKGLPSMPSPRPAPMPRMSLKGADLNHDDPR